MKIETLYTGGGITLAEVNLDQEHYAVVSSDAPDCLTVYKRTEDGDAYMPEDMVHSTHKDDLDEDLKKLHAEMVAKLK